MDKSKYPSLYCSADAASLRAQSTYILLHKVYLGSLVLSSAISAIASIGYVHVNTYLYSVLAAVLVIGFIILWMTRARQDDKIWFDGRAVAESVKCATWKFMMRAQPFTDDSKAERLFISNLKEIREARPHLGRHLAAANVGEGATITEFMKEMRGSFTVERQGFYRDERIRDQKAWYATKAKSNADSGLTWFWIMAFLQIAIVVLAIVQAASAGFGINPIPIVMTSVAAIAAWSQMKRHSELSQSYALAAQELEEIEAIAGSQMSEEEFSQLVEQSEDSISREHTLWCARRDVRLSKAGGTSLKKEG